MDNLTELLLGNKDGFIKTDKRLIKLIGVTESIFLCELIAEYDYWNDRNELNNGYFFSTEDNIYNETGLTGKQQKRIVKKLIEMELISKYNGKMNSRYFKIRVDNILNLLNGNYAIVSEVPKGNYNKNSDNDFSPEVTKSNFQKCQKVTSSSDKRELLEVPKGNRNKNNNKNNNNNIYNKNKDIEKDNIITLPFNNGMLDLENIGSSRKDNKDFSPTNDKASYKLNQLTKELKDIKEDINFYGKSEYLLSKKEQIERDISQLMKWTIEEVREYCS